MYRGRTSFEKQRDECYSANQYTLLQVDDHVLPLCEHEVELNLVSQIVFQNKFTTRHEWTPLRMNAIFTILTEQV